MIAATLDLPVVLVGGALILVAIVLAYRLLNRDPDVKRARWGVFVERERYEESETETETETWPHREENQ